jgi:proteasome accessory factor C
VSTTDRLSRLLALVPYLLARPGIRIADAAEDLGVTEKQLRDDLQLLFVCGLPGYGPGDLIDMSLDDDTVTITYDAGMDRPLRLAADEAVALVVALRSLAEVPGLTTGDVVERALAKLESAAGDAAGAAGRVEVRSFYSDETTMRAVSGALERGHALHLTYYTAGRDATTERVVDPMRLLLVSGQSYLEAWCRRAEAVRRFRLDRIDALTELDEPSAPPAQATKADVRDGVFQPSGDHPLVTLRVGRASRWITEYYPCEDVREEPGGRWLVELRASDLAWARRLVMGLGSDAEVVAPRELAGQIRAEAAAALAAYGPPDSRPRGPGLESAV